MIVAISNWDITKAGHEDSKVVNVRMVANSLKADKENDIITREAFNDKTVKEFVENGIIDWHHQSVLGRTQEERAQAVLGKPYDFKWEDNKPVVYGTLTKTHPIVKDAILPHLEAGQNVFGASVGGNIVKATTIIDNNKPKKKILEINWTHLAIAPLPYVISYETSVSIVKAYGTQDVMIQYSDLSAFRNNINIIENEQQIRKAIMAGVATDTTQIRGGQALQSQSLEGAQERNRQIAIQIIMGIADGTIEPTEDGIYNYLDRIGVTYWRDRRDIIALFRDMVDSFVSGRGL